MLILGGYGRLGVSVASLLLRETDVELILSGRRREVAAAAAGRLNALFPGNRVAACALDASDMAGMAEAFKGVEAALVCITHAGHTGEILHSALAAGTDCVDFRFPQKTVASYRLAMPAIEKSGRCVITQAGHFPGLASAFLRLAVADFKRTGGLTLATAMNVPSLDSPGAAEEAIAIFRDLRAEVWQDGRWERAGIRGARKVDLGVPFGVRWCVPTFLEEMAGLPERHGVGRAGVYVAGVNGFVNAVVVPLAMGTRGLGARSVTRLLARLLRRGIRTFSRPPFGAVFRVEAEGERDDGRAGALEITAYHGDSYYFAASAAVAGLLQYLDGSVAKPGLWFMGHEADPRRLLNDMTRFGVDIREARPARLERAA